MDATSLSAWEPNKSDLVWNHTTAAHLLRKSGFAPSVSEINQALKVGPSHTVDRLIDDKQDSSRFEELDALGNGIASRKEIDSLRGWWLLKMHHSSRPLHARLAMMWHNHFATSNVKVASPPSMLKQLRIFEKHAIGSFADMLLAMSKNSAMIIWLDAAENTKGRPNENFARELFELFSLGIGNYTEKDIQESARAFTGWSQKNGAFRFRTREHDEGEKTVLGAKGNLGGEDVCKIASEHPACARFIAHRLLREFVKPNPEPQLVQRVADVLTTHNMNIAEALRAILKSEAFFHPSTYRARIKSPVEFVLGMSRSLSLNIPADLLSTATTQMSQKLFEPPSVKGWDGHKTWINSTTMLVRLNAAQKAAEFISNPDSFFTDQQNGSAISTFSELLLDGNVPPPLSKRIANMGNENSKKVINLLLTSPEYQMS